MWNKRFLLFLIEQKVSRGKLSFLHTLFLENEGQIDQSNYGTMRFMSKQVSLWKISSILQKNENRPKTDIRPFCTKAFNYLFQKISKMGLVVGMGKTNIFWIMEHRMSWEL